jgi:hypothetical protein
MKRVPSRIFAAAAIATFTITVAAADVAGATAGTERADTVLTEPSGQALRGTDRPLERKATAVQYTGRVLLFVPYAATRVVTWPAEKLVEVNERWNVSDYLSRVVIWSDTRGDIRLTFGYESGMGMSIAGIEATTYNFLTEGADLELTAAYLNDRTNLVSLRYQKPAKRSDRVWYQLYLRYANKDNRPFFGVGPNSPNIQYATHRRRSLAEGSVDVRLHKSLFMEITGYAREQQLFDPGDGLPVRDGFPVLYAQAEKSQYAGGELGFVVDNRNAGFYSTSGGMIRLTGGYNHAFEGDDQNYVFYDIDMQKYINLYQQTRAIGLFAFVTSVEGDDPIRVPYTEYERLGGKTGARGYTRYRFVDKKYLLLATSYRWRVTQMVLGRLFVDWGTVASEWGKVRLADISPSVGFGLSAGGSNRRLDFHIAWSEEGYEIYVGTTRFSDYKSRRLR